MQGVRVRDERGNIIVSENTTTAVILGSFVLPAGTASGGRVTVGVNAPPGVNFTKNKPFIFCINARGVRRQSYDFRGETVFAGYQTHLVHAYLLMQYAVTNISANYCEVVALAFRAGITEDLHFIYGYAG